MTDVDSQPAWHALTAGEVLGRVGGGAGGLSAAEAGRRLQTFGPNRLPAARRQGPLVRFLLQFHNILIYVLLGSAAVTIANT